MTVSSTGGLNMGLSPGDAPCDVGSDPALGGAASCEGSLLPAGLSVAIDFPLMDTSLETLTQRDIKLRRSEHRRVRITRGLYTTWSGANTLLALTCALLSGRP